MASTCLNPTSPVAKYVTTGELRQVEAARARHLQKPQKNHHSNFKFL